MKRAITFSLTCIVLLLAGLLFSNFLIPDVFKRSTPERSVRDLDPNRGIVMCASPAQFNFNFTGDTTLPIAPLLDGLGDLHVPVTTKSEKAQVFFDQGVRLTYGFNHAEAHRAFREAARLDPACAMAYWGQAYALGPNINDPFPDENRQKQAYEAIQKAVSLKSKASAKEQALIDALTKRCINGAAEDQNALNVAYKNAMASVYQKFRNDPEVATLYGASIMNTMPWDYYEKDLTPKESTESAVAAFEKVLQKYPEHPGAHHYYIHIVELVNPDKAVPSADALTTLMPNAGHIVHMPSHIYMRVGRYEDASESNRQAIEADEDYISQCQAQGVYPLAYYPHNLHFLWFASTMQGNSEEAIDAAEKTAAKIPATLAVDIPFLQDFLSVPLQAYARFGKWNQVLTTPPPNKEWLHTTMIWHYARGMAFTRKGRLDMAQVELNAIKEILKNPAIETLYAAYNNPTSKVTEIACEALEGEMAAAAGDYEKAIKLLKAAVQHEDDLVYQEPSAWHYPVRQSLGAVLVDAGKYAEAAAVYKKDLEKHRDNGWSLFGLHQCLVALGNAKEAKKIRNAFEDAWAYADVALTSSRF